MNKQMIFAKKGSPSAGPSSSGPPSGHPALVVTIGHGGAGKADPGDAGMSDDSGGDSGEQPGVVQCPNCGCQFDATSGDIVNSGEYGGAQGDNSDSGQGAPPPMPPKEDAQ